MKIRRASSDNTRSMFHLAWPALLENVLATMSSFVNTAMVGGLGAAATAAVAVNTTPTWLFNGLVTAISVGGTALVARQIGAGERKEAEATCAQVFLGILAFSALLCAVALSVAHKIPVWMHADPAIHARAASYMRITALGFIPHYTGMALGAALRGAGDTKSPMQIALGANLLNVLGNYLLIFPPRTMVLGSLSFPVWGAGLGVVGAAISTAVSLGLGGLLMILRISRPKSRLRLSFQKLRPDLSIMRRILRVGFPTALERVTISVGQILYVGMISSLGTAELAAHHLSITVESLSFMPGYAFGVAATTLVGQSLGAKDIRGAKASGGLTIRTGILFMSLVGVCMFLFAPLLIGLLTPDAQVRQIGTLLIRICSFEQPFMAMNTVGAAALRGAGDTQVPFWISLAGMWGVRLILAWALIHFGLGVGGAWIAMVADQGIRSLLMGIRFARGKWVLARV